jgi:hypothetical protein
MTKNKARVALISATTAAIAPAEAALRREFPGAEIWNLVDDRLLSDANERGGLDDALRARMERLIAYAADDGAAGILLTCSMYGSVAMSTRLPIPVLAPDEAAIDELAASGHRRIMVLASLETALADAVDRVRTALGTPGRNAEVVGVFAPGALAATTAGDQAALVRALVNAAQAGDNVDAVFLAQYSLAPAGAKLAAAIGRPVLSGPISSAIRLREAIERR